MIRRRTGAKGKKAELNLTGIFSEIKKKLYSDAAKVIDEGFTEIVNNTPVETGYAASNWRVHFGDKRGGKAPPKTGGPYRDKPIVIEDGKQVIRILRKNGFGERLLFRNPTPYIGVLEQTHSQHQFWIKASIKKMENKLSTMRIRKT